MLKILVTLALLVVGTTATAQTNTINDTATAYGARLTAKGKPANQNSRRVNNRIASRVDNRLSLRIERYQVNNADDALAGFKTKQDDNTRMIGRSVAVVPGTAISAPAPTQAY